MEELKPKGRGDDHIFDFSKITDQIYIGSDFCSGGVCKIHAEEFKNLGVGFELNLSQEENELPPKKMEVGYLWLPVLDGFAPTLAQFAIGTAAIHEAIKNGKKVYVHCKNGHARSPSMVAAYLIRYQGYTLEEALSLIKEKRSEVHIEDNQIEALRKFSLYA